MAEQRLLVTERDCPARAVPSGVAHTIPAHQFVTLTQSLGGNYTVQFQGNLYRVDGTDADALGLPRFELSFPPPTSGKIDIDQVWQALESVYDPEIPVDLRSLGLIYGLQIDEAKQAVAIQMTLTAPTCGMGPVLVGDVKYRVAQVPHVRSVEVELVFSPPWSRERMSEAAQLETGLFF